MPDGSRRSIALPYNSAVREQRKSGPKALDYLPTQPWAVRALVEHVLTPDRLVGTTVLEPANGAGDIARALVPYCGRVLQADIVDYKLAGIGGAPVELGDFLASELAVPVDWVITNPPFNKAAAFIKHALRFARRGVAMIVRTSFLESVGRYTELYSRTPPDLIAIHSERVPMFVGRLDPDKSTATSYTWLVWFTDTPPAERRNRVGSPTIWVPPCRKHLERPDDYHGWRHFTTPWGPLPRLALRPDDDIAARLGLAVPLLRPHAEVRVREASLRGQVTLLERRDGQLAPLAHVMCPPGLAADVAEVVEDLRRVA